MRELDVLLSRYLEVRFDRADDTEKASFEALLALPDPQLARYLLGQQRPESEPIAHVVEQVRRGDSA